MIRIDLSIKCDECRGFCREVDTVRFDIVFRRDIHQMRETARRHGWRRFRKTVTAPFGDYCPKCTASILTNKP